MTCFDDFHIILKIGYVIDFLKYIKSNSYPVCICKAKSVLVDWRRGFGIVDFKW